MKKQKQEQTGQVNFVWALAGGYLIYLGGKLLYSLYRDGAGSSPILVVIPAAAVFIGVLGRYILPTDAGLATQSGAEKQKEK